MLHLKDQWVLKKLIIERSHGRSKTLSSQRMKGDMWQNPLFEFLRLSWFLFNPTPKSCGEAAGRSPFDEAHDRDHPASDVGYKALTHAETRRPKGKKRESTTDGDDEHG